MEDDIHAGASATSKAVATASTHDTTNLKVGHYPVVDADTALVAVPLQLPDPFWTLCDNCRFQFEYEFKYRDLLIKCPQCSNLFIAKENYKVARTVDLVSPAQYQKNKCLVPKGKVAVQKLEAFQPTENVNVPESSQPIGGQGAFRESGEKRKMKELITPPGADYKVQLFLHKYNFGF
jgi:DNA-directed RNA polymerase subunit RPC12/RpoP